MISDFHLSPPSLPSFPGARDTNGDEVWRDLFGTSETEIAFAVEVDSGGNVFVAGYTGGTLGSSSAGATDIFVRRYFSTGAVDWTVQFGSAASEFTPELAIDSSDQPHVVAFTTGAMTGMNAGAQDVFAVQLNTSGVVQWTYQTGSIEADLGLGIDVDSSGNVYFVGRTMGDLANVSEGKNDVFSVKLNSSGAVQWEDQYGSEGADIPYGIVIDSTGAPFVVGDTEETLGEMSLGSRDYFVSELIP